MRRWRSRTEQRRERMLLLIVGVMAACADPVRVSPPARDPVAARTLAEVLAARSREAPDSASIARAPVQLGDFVLASSAPIEIEGPPSAATVVLKNRATHPLSFFYWFLDIYQGNSWVEAGFGYADCGVGIGVLPPGRCALRRLSFTATHSGRHIGTLVPGPAVLSYTLVHAQDAWARAIVLGSIPVTLTGTSGTQVIVAPPVFNFGAPGGGVQLSATVLPSGSPQGVTWTSSQPGVGTVSSNGWVDALAAGATLVVATSTADPTKQGSALVSVETQPRFGNGVNVSPGEWNALTGMSVHLAAQVVGAPLAVFWSSGIPSVATVDATGLVTAVAAGPVSITATSGADPTRSATVTGNVLDFDWKFPVVPTKVSTGSMLPAANPLSVPLGVTACGPHSVFFAPYGFVDFAVQSGGAWVSVGTTSSISVVDDVVMRCWSASIDWTPGTAFGTGSRTIRATLRDKFGSAVLTQLNTNVTITTP